MGILYRLVSVSAALAVAAWLLDGIRIAGATWQDKVPTLLVVAVILALVNAVVAPVAKLLSLPVIILTLGLFLLVVNALMLLLTAWVADQFDVGFTVNGFWNALVGGLVISLVTMFVSSVLGDDR
ncbi:phage holin family protein [Nocardioides donggukensis]|uniref:Phage holin family protein n=1 Tax=Nocardioides donggukensis TaxID=2774019 RepID=A0A927K138_9ACTN|nr:phage holin family protein [Nocardioides donggukensis]MBD8868152.1 phage holin family protein [Nocardioides donggukensis]